MGRIILDLDDDDIEYAGDEWAGDILFWMIIAIGWELLKAAGIFIGVATLLALGGFQPLATLYAYAGLSFVDSVPVAVEFFATFLLLIGFAIPLIWLFVQKKNRLVIVLSLSVSAFFVLCGFRPLFALLGGPDFPLLGEFVVTFLLAHTGLILLYFYIQKRME